MKDFRRCIVAQVQYTEAANAQRHSTIDFHSVGRTSVNPASKTCLNFLR